MMIGDGGDTKCEWSNLGDSKVQYEGCSVLLQIRYIGGGGLCHYMTWLIGQNLMPVLRGICDAFRAWSQFSLIDKVHVQLCIYATPDQINCAEVKLQQYLIPYLIFVIFLHEQNFWRIKFTPKNAYITTIYTVNCQFYALNL